MNKINSSDFASVWQFSFLFVFLRFLFLSGATENNIDCWYQNIQESAIHLVLSCQVCVYLNEEPTPQCKCTSKNIQVFTIYIFFLTKRMIIPPRGFSIKEARFFFTFLSILWNSVTPPISFLIICLKNKQTYKLENKSDVYSVSLYYRNHKDTGFK